ncbi:MAG: threonylcarbamoyl-AMP synthase [Treponema sp.]|jgi:L-threonylcarbamoyladenylate synthase|nr:threonylcarbamoyl-AMP synthase [Treponema sp.]
MKILSLSNQDLAKAAGAVSAGGLVVFPTETVYGLGGDAFNISALARIFEIKNRPHFDPLIIHIADTAWLDRLVHWELMGSRAKEKLNILAKHFWPGPLTLVLPKRPELPDLATGGLQTAAIRFPAFEAARKLISLSKKAVAAPSANPFGFLSPTRAGHVCPQLGDKADFVIDGGRAVLGLESTVLDLSDGGPRILRRGALSLEKIEALIGPVETPEPAETGTALKSPGRLKSHYAPRTPLCLYPYGGLAALPEISDAKSLGEGRLYFSGPQDTAGGRIRTLSPVGNLTEAAANFFDMLHELDKMGLSLIRAEEAPQHGLGAAINDRLRRAAAAFNGAAGP